VKTVLTQAIAAGGTTLRDFVDGSGRPGYFQQTLHAYGRAGQPCPRCATPMKNERLAQRATVFCPRCQR
jgi:formamidopyrimidine-DNA glycosylase